MRILCKENDRLLRKIDYDKVVAFIEDQDWSGLRHMCDPKLQASFIQQRCAGALQCGASYTRIKSRFRPIREWMNPGLVRAICIRRRLYRRLRRHGTIETQICYESYNKCPRTTLRREEDKFYRGKIQQRENDIKGVRRYINSYIRERVGGGSLDPSLIGVTVEAVNEFSVGLGPKTVADGISCLDPPDLLPPQRPNFFSNSRIPSVQDIECSLNQINEC